MKTVRLILKCSLALLAVILLIAIAVLVQQVDPAQKRPDFQPYSFADTLVNHNFNLDSLKAIIGDNKGLPPGFEITAAIAFSAYPQLKDVRIDMMFTNYGPPMMADINIWSLFGPANGRQYQIKLNDAKDVFFDPILLRSLPFDAQVGILAHELGHVAYYHKLNAFQIAKWGLCYLQSDEFHVIHERTTDLMPVYHGLGSQIYQYAYYVRKDPSCEALFKAEQSFIDKYYMTDQELLEALNE